MLVGHDEHRASGDAILKQVFGWTQSVRFKTFLTCQLTADYFEMILCFEMHGTASWPNTCVITTLTETVFHS